MIGLLVLMVGPAKSEQVSDKASRRVKQNIMGKASSPLVYSASGRLGLGEGRYTPAGVGSQDRQGCLVVSGPLAGRREGLVWCKDEYSVPLRKKEALQ